VPTAGAVTREMLFAVNRSVIADATQERGPICGKDAAEENCVREKS
jgi:hypothetical protein